MRDARSNFARKVEFGVNGVVFGPQVVLRGYMCSYSRIPGSEVSTGYMLPQRFRSKVWDSERGLLEEKSVEARFPEKSQQY